MGAHSDCLSGVSFEPVHVLLETPFMSSCQLIDLPGFRELALDKTQQRTSDNIQKINMSFMQDPQYVILCVEHADDAANLTTLERVGAIDPAYERTILVMNKLDKYYNDLSSRNVNQWISGYGALPDSLLRFTF